MASRINDRVLWLCLGVTLFFAARGIGAELYRVRELTAIRKGEKEDQVIGEGTEDALKLETLQKLSESTSFDLRSAALRIISERSTKGSTRDLLLEDLSSKIPTVRNKALNALHFLGPSINSPSSLVSRSAVSSRLKDLPTYSALVDCLCSFLPEHKEENNNIVSDILPKTRPQGEMKALSTLEIILRENVPAALEAGVVSRWLSKYPFPGVAQNESLRIKVVGKTLAYHSDDPVMYNIISILFNHEQGMDHLRKYGLMEDHMNLYTHDGADHGDYDDDSEDEDPSDSDSDVWMVDGEETAGISPWSSRRRREGTAEEQALRRRRREAMVFSEGGRPLGNDDIIQPIRNREDEELDAELEQLADEVDRELREEQLEAERREQPRRSWPNLWPFS
ncbi:hypothetical protein FQN52_008914 [Onygenales sp. PD_12]|nr:hypothetical protein FQN52_008914 [Onygenales sp. PD_12]